MDRLDQRAVEKLSSQARSKIRPTFAELHRSLVSVSPSVIGSLTTIYIKYTDGSDPRKMPFAVVWVKKVNQLVVGLALPGDDVIAPLKLVVPGYKYAGLSAYLVINEGESVPSQFTELAHAAYKFSESIH